MEDEIPGRFAAYLSQGLQALEVFADYDLHPEIVFQSNYASIPPTREAAIQAGKEAFEYTQQGSHKEDASATPDSGYSAASELETCLAPWADFEEIGFETLVDHVLAAAFADKRDATGTGGL